MSLASIVTRLTRALPAVLAAAPTVLDAVKQVREALRKPKAPAAGGSDAQGVGAAPEAAGRLSADSERAAR